MTESRTTPDKAQNHVVAVFDHADQVSKALDALRGAGIADDAISVLGRDETRDGDGAPETSSPEDFAEASTTAGRGVMKGGAVGGAAGGLLGLLGGALAVALPGVGTAVGVGMLVGAVSGATAGATAGSLWSGFERMWDMGYRDMVAEGGVLVAVHTDDQAEADTAKRVLTDLGPRRIDHLDSRGEVVRAA
jgi:hypothetical protein